MQTYKIRFLLIPILLLMGQSALAQSAESPVPATKELHAAGHMNLTFSLLFSEPGQLAGEMFSGHAFLHHEPVIGYVKPESPLLVQLRYQSELSEAQIAADPNRFPRPTPEAARVPWYKSKWFWIGVGATAAVTSTAVLINQSQPSPERPPLFLPPPLPQP
ncbi:hypothetical protein CYPRO_0677 [Cyclonatronum proteinivorum]|uniref:Uncharacterized protein n=1 Tax=Cyclonatronum proteinivorum TaxID=1457365 RepID=A0A345UHK9_9BACT|nr:hypothetical protein [Cyclonatronum proteinivorum]AXI99960.1 hypothetical protein CYPRO_0677 [Cyclonatronum proteinivorum]